jgi:hypothetical protein
MPERAAPEIGHGLAGFGLEDPGAGLFRQRLELLDGGGPADVAGRQQDLLALLPPEPGELAGSRGLARAVQAQQQDLRRQGGQVEIALDAAEQATSSSWMALTICCRGHSARTSRRGSWP